jgi:hypothetical protein
MMRRTVALVAATLFVPCVAPAARAQSPAAEPFPTVPIQAQPRRSHAVSYLTIAGGAALIGYSFALNGRADRAYDDYLSSTDPGEIETLYDRTVHFDRLSQASLLTGELLVAAGLYLRFIRRPQARAVSFRIEPARCALSYRF